MTKAQRAGKSMFERSWRPAFPQPAGFLKARELPFQGHVTSTSSSTCSSEPLPSPSSELRGLQTSLSLSQRQNCFSGWLTRLTPNLLDRKQNKNKQTKPGWSHCAVLSGNLSSDTSDSPPPKLGCFWTWVFSKHPWVFGLWAVWETNEFLFKTSRTHSATLKHTSGAEGFHILNCWAGLFESGRRS